MLWTSVRRWLWRQRCLFMNELSTWPSGLDKLVGGLPDNLWRLRMLLSASICYRMFSLCAKPFDRILMSSYLQLHLALAVHSPSDRTCLQQSSASPVQKLRKEMWRDSLEETAVSERLKSPWKRRIGNLGLSSSSGQADHLELRRGWAGWVLVQGIFQGCTGSQVSTRFSKHHTLRITTVSVSWLRQGISAIACHSYV